MGVLDAQAQQLQLNQTVYEVPKPIFSKNGYDVIPIGSCPVCGSECGTGIRSQKTKQWYCVQSNCAAFDKDVYDVVYRGKTIMPRQMGVTHETQEKNRNIASRQDNQKAHFNMVYKELYWKRWLHKYNAEHTTNVHEKASQYEQVANLEDELRRINNMLNAD
jgi:hypothetical protein